LLQKLMILLQEYSAFPFPYMGLFCIKLMFLTHENTEK
jgi:hypothetical protein